MSALARGVGRGSAALLLGWAVLSPGCTPDAPDSGDAAERVVAEVNGVPITADRLDAVIEADLLRLGRDPDEVADDERSAMARDALELLIRGELVYQAALERGMEIPADAIDEQLDVLRSQFATPEEYQDYLEQAGTTTEELREEARRRLLMQAYAATVTQETKIDEERARRLYEQQIDRFRGGDAVRVAQILVRLRPEDSDERRRAARRKIDEAYRRAVAGEDFAELAREYSESPLAEQGGDMGFLPRGRMLPEFEEVVFATPVGRITPVFETPYGFNVVKVLERREGRVRSFEEVKTGLLLVLAREKKDDALRRHVDGLEARADIRILDPVLRRPPG